MANSIRFLTRWDGLALGLPLPNTACQEPGSIPSEEKLGFDIMLKANVKTTRSSMTCHLDG
jgi:hypothetical protein